MPERRFPRPWSIEEFNDACFIVKPLLSKILNYLLSRQASSSPGLQKPTCQLSLVREPTENFSAVSLNATSCAGSNLNARFRFAPGNSSSAATSRAQTRLNNPPGDDDWRRRTGSY